MKSYYRSRDLAESAFLYSSHKKLIKTERDELGRTWFVFEDKAACQQLADAFLQREAIINAKDYSESLRTLKNLLHK